MHKLPWLPRLALVATIVAASAGPALANSIVVPNGTLGGQCNPNTNNPNTARFSGYCGSLVTVGSGDTTPAFVQDNTSNAEGAYNVRFNINMRGLDGGSNALGGPLTVFAAYDGADPTPPTVAGNEALRVIVQPGGNPHQIVIAARLDGGTYASTTPVNLPLGWRSIEIHWAKGAGSGSVQWWLNGNAQTGLSSLANNTEAINYARWGALAITAGTAGTFKLDDFASQRSGYIGPASAFDIPTTGTGSNYWPFAQSMWAAEAMQGCSVTAFCRTSPLTRREMAKVLLLGRYGGSYVPPACPNGQTLFTDVACGDVNADWIYDLAARGITAGCSVTPKMYCPEDTIARKDQMVFLYKGMGTTFPNGGCGVSGNPANQFDPSDTPTSANYCPYVNQAYTDGVTAGCNVSPLKFCPLTTLTRGDIAAFEQKVYVNLNPELQKHIVGP